MFEQARPASAEADADETAMLYEGYLTKLVTQELRLATPMYTSILNQLKRMGCIKQLRRGGSTTPSVWELVYEPTLEAFVRAVEPKTPKQTKESQLQAQVDALQTEVNKLKVWQEGINDMLVDKFGEEKVSG